MGIPAALAAPVVTALDLVGGTALIAGLLTRVFAAPLAVDLLGAVLLVHVPAGIFGASGGFELVLMPAARRATACAAARTRPAHMAARAAIVSPTRAGSAARQYTRLHE